MKPVLVILSRVFVSFSIFIVFYVIGLYIKSRYDKKQKKNLINYELGDIIFYVVIVLGIFFALINFGIEQNSLFAVFGSVGLALALSLQGLLSNIASGFYIGVNNLYEIGDSIQFVSNGTLMKGTVKSFNLFNTTILVNNIPTIIPNTFIQNNIFQKSV